VTAVSLTRPRRRSKSAQPEPGLGAVLIELRSRARLTQVTVAKAAGISATQLSRLERGRRSGVSIDLLEAIDDALDANGRVLAAAEVLPAPARQALCSFYRAFSGRILRDQTIPAVSAAHYAAIAADFWRRAASEHNQRVQLPPLCREVGLDVDRMTSDRFRLTFTPGRAVVEIPRTPNPDLLPRERFLTAHALGHELLTHVECAYPSAGDNEEAATTIACHVLAPGELLMRVADGANQAPGSGGEPWSFQGGTEMIAAISSRLGIPAWVAVRRLAEQRYFETIAEEAL
jgi:transcriptional regulator with XRE-family HTH domain